VQEIQGPGYWIQSPGSWILDPESWIQSPGFRVLALVIANGLPITLLFSALPMLAHKQLHLGQSALRYWRAKGSWWCRGGRQAAARAAVATQAETIRLLLGVTSLLNLRLSSCLREHSLEGLGRSTE